MFFCPRGVGVGFPTCITGSCDQHPGGSASWEGVGCITGGGLCIQGGLNPEGDLATEVGGGKQILPSELGKRAIHILLECFLFVAASNKRMRFGSREQSVYPRPKNMPYIPTWREEEHSEMMTPESTTIPTCECACVYVCVQCGGRRSTRR